MKIAHKLICSYGLVALLVGVVGFFGLTASRQIVKFFEGGEKHIRSIVAAATEISGYVKAAESRLMLYLTLHEGEDREKFLEKLEHLQDYISLLGNQLLNPEARRILEKIDSKSQELASVSQSLLKAHDNDIERKGEFAFSDYRELIRSLNENSAAIRKYGMELAKFQTDFLNKQEAITAATEVNSFATRAESHIMLFLTLQDLMDRNIFFQRMQSLQERIDILNERLTTQEGRAILGRIKYNTDQLFSIGKDLFKAYQKDARSTGTFNFANHRELIKRLHTTASAVRDDGIELAELNLSLETQPKEIAIRKANILQRHIVTIGIASFVLALVLGYIMAKTISKPIKKLKAISFEIGRGHFETKIEISSKDEIGDLARSIGKMAEDLKKTTVSRDYMDSIIRNMLDSLIVLSPEGKIITVNEPTCRLLGYEEHELIKQPLMKVLGDESALKGLELGDLIKKGTIDSIETSYASKNGTRIPVLFSGSVMHGSEDNIQGIVCMAQDISDRKKLEEELIKNEKLRSLGILAGGIAHDFNNMLTAISSNVSLAKISMKPDEKAFKRLTQAENALAITSNLTQQLLTFAGGGEPIKKAASIGELMKDSADFALRGSNVKGDYYLPADLWPVQIDEGQISQVIRNIIINTVEAMPKGGTVKVRGENIFVNLEDGLPLREGKYVRITIEDDGPGIPKEHLIKIFDPYFTTKEKGSGLGLSICYSIIKKHDGHIAVKSQAGAGVTFFIHLPVALDESTSSQGEIEDEEDIYKGKGKILIMDDEEIIREVTGELLKALEYQVDYATNGTEAIDIYKGAMETGNPFDAIIMDLTIAGGMGGQETIQRLREIDPAVKAIVSSGYSNDSVMADHKKYGFKGVVAKPYKLAEMGKVLRKVLKGLCII